MEPWHFVPGGSGQRVPFMHSSPVTVSEESDHKVVGDGSPPWRHRNQRPGGNYAPDVLLAWPDRELFLC